ARSRIGIVSLPGGIDGTERTPLMEMWGFAGSMAADVFSKEKRSDIMRKIRAKNTRWERNFRGELSRRKLRYRVHYGADKIDVAFVHLRGALFLDSCFCHFCPVHRDLPKAHRSLWEAQLHRNRQSDLETS